MKKLLIIITFIFISFYSTISYAEYVANGQIKGWVCNWGTCSMQNLDAVKSGSSYYTIKKNHKSMDLIGASPSFVMDYLQAKFTEGMTWENHGDWHIDHIQPCCSFDLTDEEEQKKCFHYTNLQPLWAIDNLKKGGKF